MSAAPVILGIDPGLSGALAVLDASGAVADVFDMPTLCAGNGRRTIDAVALAQRLRDLRPIRACWIEAVAAMPTDGRASAFAFGRSLGMVEAAILLTEAPLHRVTPAAWKRWAGIAPKAPKAASIEAAKRLVPGSARHLARASDHGRADAMLIARYGLLTGYE